MYDCATLVASNGQKNVVVSNGYINPAPLKKILPLIDAFNIDLKAFNEDFYRDYAKASLQPVLETLKIIAGANKHLEITFLAIPGVNDDPGEFREMVSWIAQTLGDKIPLHISRYFPSYKLDNPPTPVATLENFYDIAKEFLKYVYLGNVADEKRSSTYCPNCGRKLVTREHYSVKINALDGSKCNYCSAETGIIL
jgi:pyruvate formate lyase activating enzyme